MAVYLRRIPVDDDELRIESTRSREFVDPGKKFPMRPRKLPP